MNENTRWGTRRAGDVAQIDNEDPTIAIVGLPDWFELPTDDALGAFSGRKARRVASVYTTPNELWHVLSVNEEIVRFAIREQPNEFAVAELGENQIAFLLLLAARNRKPDDASVLVHCDNEQSAIDLREALRDDAFGGDHA